MEGMSQAAVGISQGRLTWVWECRFEFIYYFYQYENTNDIFYLIYQ